VTGSRTDGRANRSDIKQQMESTSCNGAGVQCGLHVLRRDLDN